MKRLSRVMITTLAVIAFGTLFAPAARASCVTFDESQALWRLPAVSAQPLRYGPVARFIVNESTSDASIVGFWRVEFTADGDDTPFDSAYVQWHSDGTEIMNSSRDPRTQSFCLGVWKKAGAFSYKLKHFAMSWDGAGNPVGPAEIIEYIDLDQHADTFTGRFVITQYKMDGTTVLVSISGSLSGTRITAN